MFVDNKEAAATEGFRVNANLRGKLANRKCRTELRLDKNGDVGSELSMPRAANMEYDLDDRAGLTRAGRCRCRC
jgi:hypothetical protein